MQFFILGRDRPGAGETRRALLPAHWDFMSRYAETMIARGPTMAPDGKSVTGSMHIVDLPDAEAARVFAHDDPLAVGGVFEVIEVRLFGNLSGRTMWQFYGDATRKRFLFIGEADADGPGPTAAGIETQRRWLSDAGHAANLIVFGSLLGGDGLRWQGTVMLLEASDVAQAQAIVSADPLAGFHARQVLQSWRFGGQENLKDLVAPRPG